MGFRVLYNENMIEADENKKQVNNDGQQWDSLSSIPFNKAEIPLSDIAGDIAKTDVTVYERLNASNDAAAKDEFLENPDLTHPNNEYGNLDPNEVKDNLGTLSTIKTNIEQANLSEQQKNLLRILYADCYKKNDFLLANIEYNSANTPEEKEEAARHHREANEALYGKADEDKFYTLLREKLAAIDVDSLSPEDKEKYDKLLSDIGPLKEVTSDRFIPKPETVQRFGEYVREFFKGFLKHIPADQEEFTGSDMARIVNEILAEEFSDEPDSEAAPYQAIVSSSASNASANHETRQIIFSDRKTYPRNKAAAIIVHELGTHVMRAIPYVEQDITSFSTGFPDNETFDEGVAKCVEQALAGKYTDSGVDHYINIGLATFMGKNFREIYDIQHTINDLSGQPSKTLINSVQRCFRGTGELVNNKDLAYYNGSEMVWKYIEDHIDDPELFDHLFLTGKLDITNPDQERISYEKRTGSI